MAGKPVVSETYVAPRTAFCHASVWAALDAGNSLLKLIYVAEEESTAESALVTVQGRVYRLTDLSAALHELQDRCRIPAGAELRVTGVWIAQWHAEIESFLGVRLRFADELIAQTVGAHFLLEKVGGDLCYPDLGKNPCFDPPDVPAIWERRPFLLQQMTANNHDETSGICPANFLVIGSAATFTHMDSNGRVDVQHISMMGGLSFLALSKLLLNTDDYDEIMALASRSNKNGSETDVSVGDWAPGGEVSAQCPLSLFTFGKIANSSAAPPCREDVAASLVAFFAEVVFTLALDVAERTGISRFYVTGNWTRSLEARQALCSQWSLFHPAAIEFKFLKTGLATAFGASMLDLDAMEQYFLAKPPVTV